MEDFAQLTEKLRSADEETRRLAVTGLAAYSFPAVREALFLAMGDASWRVRKETVDVIQSFPFSGEIVELLVEMLRSHDNAGMRNSSVETLERLGSSAVPILVRYLQDDDQDVRKFVIDILGHIGDPVVIPQLLSALRDADPNVCAAAAENLGRIGDARAVPELLRVLTPDSLWLCYTVLEALTKIGTPVPFAVIAPLAGEEFLRKAVFDCLGVVGDAHAVPLLVEGLASKAKRTREAAALALFKLQERLSTEVKEDVSRELRTLVGSPCVDALLSSFKGAEKGLREALIAILGTIGDPRAVKDLLQCCHDEGLRRQCLEAFRNMGKKGVQTLLDAFATAQDDERCLIAYLFGELQCVACASELREGMRNPYFLLRKISAGAAGAIGLTSLTGDVALLLDDAEPEVREAAIAVLCRFADRDRDAVTKIAVQLATADFPEKRRSAALLFAALADVERLARLVKDADAMVRKAAVMSLAGLQVPSAADWLVMALADEEADVRIAAAGVLGSIGGSSVIAPLLLALKDPDMWVCSAALKSLGRLGSEELLPALEEVFETAEGLVLVSAIEALAEIGSENSLRLIERALESPDQDVVKAAITMLDKHGDSWLDEHWERLIAHPHWDVRSSFVKVLAGRWGRKAIPCLKAALSSESDDYVKRQMADLLDGIR